MRPGDEVRSSFPQPPLFGHRRPRGASGVSVDLVAQQTAAFEKLCAYLQRWITQNVQDLDTYVFEHNTIELDPTKQFADLTLNPQTRQMERIDMFYVGLVYQVPDTTAPTVTIDNAYAELGGTLINLNALLNSSAGTGGFSQAPMGILLDEGSKRAFHLHATANFPQNLYFSAFITGRAIPQTLGGAQV